MTVALCLGHLLVYALFHLSYVLMLEETGNTAEYIYRYASLLYSLIFPALAAAAALSVLERLGRGCMLKAIIGLSLSRAVFCLPYYYIYYVSLGYDSIESLTLMLPTALAATAVSYLLILAATALSSYMGGRGKGSGRFRAAVTSAITVSLSLLIPEIVDTVVFFLEYWESFTSGEVLYMLSRYGVILLGAVAVIPAVLWVRSYTDSRIESFSAEITDKD